MGVGYSWVTLQSMWALLSSFSFGGVGRRRGVHGCFWELLPEWAVALRIVP